MAFATPQVVVASATQTTTGASPAIALSDAGKNLCLLVNVTATSGTPSMTLTVEWSPDATTFYKADPVATGDAFTAITATGAVVKAFQVKAPYYRVVWTISGGTPSLTFAVTEFVAS